VGPDELLRIHEGTRTCGHVRVCCIESAPGKRLRQNKARLAEPRTAIWQPMT